MEQNSTNANVAKKWYTSLINRWRNLRHQRPIVAAMAILLVAGGYFFVQSSFALSEPLPLGSLNFNGTPANCPAGGYTCSSFTVSCPEVTLAEQGSLAIAPGQGTPKGLVMFFTGGRGNTWWTDSGKAIDPEGFLGELRAKGYTTVQVKWNDWLSAKKNAPGTPGPARLGCRPATIVNYVHDTYYQPLGVTPEGVGQCGFCITGNSGGSSQVAYTISYYGLEDILDAVIPTEGPPHSVLEKACLRTPGEEAYWYDSLRNYIDQGFGYFGKQGPCVNYDESFRARWNETSVSTGGSDYFHPNTRVHFIYSTDGMRANGGDYVNRLFSEGSPYVIREDAAAGTPHNIMESPDGRTKLMAAILYGSTEAGSGSVPPPTTSPPPPPASPPPSVPPAEQDTQSPNVTISSPANQSSVSGVVTIAATATDNTGVVKLEIYINRVIVAAVTDGSISYDWDTAAYSSGSHSIYVRAYDAAGNTSNSNVVVNK